MHKHERFSVLSLAAIMAFRMLGLFMILPVFTIEANQLIGATPTLLGVALGIYGLTQAVLQMPLGMLSDHVGRKPIIIIGLLFFIGGSIVCALAHSIHLMILGRAIQGTGAIGSTTLALVADLTRDEHRSKAMAIMGLTIGFAFCLAIVLGPTINSLFNLSGIFWATAGLGAIGILLIYTSVPTPPKLILHKDVEVESKRLRSLLKNNQLLRLDFGIFTLHASLTALFLIIPILLTHRLQLAEFQQIMLYLVVLFIAFFSSVPLIIIAEKKRQLKPIFVGAISILLTTQIALLLSHHHKIEIVIVLLLFFSAFTLLEASLPSLISKIAPISYKGTAMGIYSTSQFLGIFTGGSIGGWLFEHFGSRGVFAFPALLCFIWLYFAVTMRHPPYLSTLIFKAIDKDPDELHLRLHTLPGVVEVAYMPNEGLVYLKVDKKIVNEDELRNRIEGGNLTA